MSVSLPVTYTSGCKALDDGDTSLPNVQIAQGAALKFVLCVRSEVCSGTIGRNTDGPS